MYNGASNIAGNPITQPRTHILAQLLKVAIVKYHYIAEYHPMMQGGERGRREERIWPEVGRPGARLLQQGPRHGAGRQRQTDQVLRQPPRPLNYV